MKTAVARSIVFAVVAILTLLACTFTRSLDYLTSGGPVTDSGDKPDIGTSSSSSSSSSSGADALGNGDGFVKAQFDPQHLTSDTDTIYWANGDGTIMAAAKATGTARKVTSPDAGVTVAWLAADPGAGAAGGFLYAATSNEVQRVPKAGGAFAFVEKDTVNAAAIVVDDQNLFIAHYDINSQATGNVSRFTKDGQNRTALSVDGDDPNAVAIQGSSVFWPGTGTDDNATPVIFELPKNAGVDAGGAAIAHGLGTDGLAPDGADSFAVDADAIYVFETPTLFRLARTAGAMPTHVYDARTGTDEVIFAIDDTNVYVAELRPDGQILRIAKTGGVPTPLATATGTAPTSIIVDEQYVYYTVEGTKNGPDGAVVRLAK